MEYVGINLFIVFIGCVAFPFVIVLIANKIFKKDTDDLGIAFLLALVVAFIAFFGFAIWQQSHNINAFNQAVSQKYNVLVVGAPVDIPAAGGTIENVQIVKDRLYLNCNAIVGAKPLDTRLFCGTLEELAQ